MQRWIREGSVHNICEVTVLMTTYNHGAFLEDALNGVLCQKTDFQFEIVVFDDCSTDNTKDILDKYMKIYPAMISVVRPKENVYEKPEAVDIYKEIFESLSSRYVAFCEGDDYWIDEFKIQKQFNRMNIDSGISICATASYKENMENGEREEFHPNNSSGYLHPKYIIAPPSGWRPNTCTLMLKREVLIKQVTEISSGPWRSYTDFNIMMFAITQGKLFYIDDITAVYRKNVPGSWSKKYHQNVRYSIIANLNGFIAVEQLNRRTESKYYEYIKRALNGILLAAAYHLRDTDIDTYKRIKMELSVSEETRTFFKSLDIVYNDFCLGHWLDKENLDRIRQSQRTVVYGTGEYSVFIDRALKKCEVEYDGYLVSKPGEHGLHEGKPVWSINKYPYELDDTLVIIGVGPVLYEAINSTLREYEVKNIIALLWRDYIE